MTGFIVIPMNWVDALAAIVPGLMPAQVEQLHPGELVTVDGVSIVAQDRLPAFMEPMRPPVDRAAHLAGLRRHLRHGWRAR